MELSPDQVTILELGPVTLNATLVFTWVVMGILVSGSWLVTRNLSSGTELSGWQNLLEAIVTIIRDQIRDITGQDPSDYLPFIGTLFLFISVANLLSVVPGYEPPTGSLSTTAALTTCVFLAVPLYGVAKRGVLGYLKNYIEPTAFMLPFNIVSEISRTVALAIRLFGNIMSGRILVGIMLSIIPLLLPTVLQILELIVGQIQAYIFATLATVYIASGTSESAT